MNHRVLCNMLYILFLFADTVTMTRGVFTQTFTRPECTYSMGCSFCKSVSISNDVMFIGGADVTVYETSGTEWTLVQTLERQGEYLFGSDLSVSNDAAIVGGYGSAYIYQNDGSSWDLAQTIVPSDPIYTDNWDETYTVSISNDAAVIGAYRVEWDACVVFVFESDGTSWNEKQILKGVDTQDDAFGTAISMSSDTLLIGAHLDDDMGADSGAVYVFQNAETSWNKIQKLVADDAQNNAFFGYSVSMYNDLAIVGAPKSEAAYIFQRTNCTWSQIQKLVADDNNSGDNFGTSVSISNGIAIVGSDLDDDKGSSYVFVNDGTSWIQHEKLAPDDLPSNGHFGRSVAVSDGAATVCGSYLIDLAYIFAPNFTVAEVTPQTTCKMEVQTTEMQTTEMQTTEVQTTEVQATDVQTESSGSKWCVHWMFGMVLPMCALVSRTFIGAPMSGL
eukprot:347664_1